MLSTEKITKGFLAIVEEAEKLLQSDISDEQKVTVQTIISIAKHQSDIRGATGTHGDHSKKCG